MKRPCLNFILTLPLVLLLFACSDSKPPKAATLCEPETTETEEKAAPEDSRKTLSGTFLTLEEGDYFYLSFADEEGDTLSFWLSEAVQQQELDNLRDPALEGSAMTVTVRNVETYIPEAEADMMITEVVEVSY